ncbi:sugar ABC transporter ATP-binding protein [Bacillus sp. FSL K6-3431]|uniref:sugar ABC transporter ATP-binding protein n=1 Tax=Bacillus sp. FSL K6-3431 TaxID=2921500 RepID=UPI0030FAEED4
MQEEIVLTAQGISKAFPGVQALNNVNFTLKRGEIHTLMGENGAGKSTLIKVLTGVYGADEGRIDLNGSRIEPKTPQEAQKLGVSTVYQEVNLCPNLSVAENIYIGREILKKGRINWGAIYERSSLLLKRLNLNIDVRKQLSFYSIAIQQMVAIARAVDISSGVLILDEPTSSLDNNEVAQLFAVMRKLKSEGLGIIFVSHFLDQVYGISDTITVLRNGELIGEYPIQELPRKLLVSKMIGRDIVDQNYTNVKANNINEQGIFLKTNDLGRKGSIESMDLTIRKGEIIGLAGLLGSGRSETAKLIFGIDKSDHGSMEIASESFQSMLPKKAIKKGIGFCPEDRKVEGVVGELSIRENIILAKQASKGFFTYISMKEQKKIAQKYIDLLRIKTPNMEERIDNLSGGNQQKVILSRWLATNPKLLILDEPTRGIDVGSKSEIRKLIMDLANEGIAILIISAELVEMVEMCDRITVLRDRQQIGVVSGESMTEKNIMDMIAEGPASA